jgi:cytochrome c peroxidase
LQTRLRRSKLDLLQGKFMNLPCNNQKTFIRLSPAPMRKLALLIGSLPLLLLLACEPEPAGPVVDDTPYIYEVPAGFPLPVERAENPLTVAKVALGKRLFYDPILSADETVSCNSCHKQEFAFADNVPISPGVAGRLGMRNAPSLANLAYVTVFHKDGGVPKLEIQAGSPIEDVNEMDLSIFTAADRLNALPEYREQFLRAFGREADAFTITRALAAFERTMISGNSAYDQYTYQELSTALNAAQLRGRDLFFSEELACSTCHTGFNFTNDGFFNNGLQLDYSNDLGLRRVSLDTLDIGKFRVPSLRNIALTAPYMHAGSLPTLEAVMEHYNSGGVGHPLQDERIRPLGLTAAEKADLIAFLESLTDEAFIVDGRFGK